MFEEYDKKFAEWLEKVQALDGFYGNLAYFQKFLEDKLGLLPYDHFDGAETPEEMLKVVRLEQFKRLMYGERLFSNSNTQGRGEKPLTVRVTGKVQTWKTRPNEFKVPVKFGLRCCGYITHVNAETWEFDELLAKKKLGLEA